MKVNYDSVAVPAAMTLGRIPVGTVFSGKIGQIRSLFLETYSGAVDLERPSSTWERGGNDDIPVVDYLVREVEIRVIR